MLLLSFPRLLFTTPVAAAFAAVLALGVQTDVLGTPWLAFVVWLLAGAGHTAALHSDGDAGEMRGESVA